MPQIDKMAPVGSRPVGCWALQLSPLTAASYRATGLLGVVLTHYKRKQEGLSPARLAFRKGQQVEHSLARKTGRPIEGGLNTVAACKSADQRDPFLGCRFNCGSGLCRKLEHCCFLIFKQVS